MSDPHPSEPVDPPRSGSAARRLLSVVLVLVVVAAALLLLSRTIRSTDTVTETFAGPVDRVVIEVNGSVSVEAGDTAEITVEREWFLTGAPAIDIVEEDGLLRIISRCGFLTIRCLVSVTATVPADAALDVDTSAGGVTVTGIGGGVDLTTSAGSVVVDGIAGPATLRTSAGQIRGTITGGDVDATTSAGGIDLAVEGEFARVSTVTSAGSIDLTVPDDIYRVETDTSAGNVTINVRTDPDASRHIFARTSAGSITIERDGG